MGGVGGHEGITFRVSGVEQLLASMDNPQAIPKEHTYTPNLASIAGAETIRCVNYFLNQWLSHLQETQT
jgi:hypothetical protein